MNINIVAYNFMFVYYFKLISKRTTPLKNEFKLHEKLGMYFLK